jgi:hypothetical protein
MTSSLRRGEIKENLATTNVSRLNRTRSSVSSEPMFREESDLVRDCEFAPVSCPGLNSRNDRFWNGRFWREADIHQDIMVGMC